jgi:uncharacterized membrane protein YgcG
MNASPALLLLTTDVVAAAHLAGGRPRSVDALLVSRLQAGRVRVVDGHLEDVRLRRTDPFDALLIDALGARGRRDVETVRWRVQRDHRLDDVRRRLAEAGLVAERTRLGRRPREDRPALTAAGRQALRDLRSQRQPGAAWEVALGGRAALTNPVLREALQPPARTVVSAAPRRSRLRRPYRDTPETYLAGGIVAGQAGWGGWGGDCGGFGGGFDGGGGGGGDGGC